MSKTTIHLVSERDRAAAFRAVGEAQIGEVVSIRQASRSMSQNAIAHVWYGQLANELREEDALGWKCFCKLHFGVPILRAEEPDFLEVYDRTIKGMGYEQKLEVMEIVPVTSIMTKPQLSKYLEAMQVHFISRGVRLVFPEVAP